MQSLANLRHTRSLLKLVKSEKMNEKTSQSIELLPEAIPAKQLFVLLHGVGSKPSDLAPLANYLKEVFPGAAFFLPEGTEPFDGGNGRQWFSISGVSGDNRISRVANAMPRLKTLVKEAQDRFSVLQSDTALIGFSQGAIMALEYSIAHDGGVGRVLAFAGRFAQLPKKAPELTTLHLLHGESDPVIPLEHAEAALARLKELNGDATLDTAALAGHEINAELADHAIRRLQTHIPLRSWKKAMEGA